MWVGQSRESVAGNLERLRIAHDPDVVFLQEAKRCDGDILPGYLNHAGSRELGDDHDNCRILLRDSFEVLARGAWKVPGPSWRWNGNVKPTRVFPFLVARRDGRVVILVSVHRIPGGPTPGIAENRRPWILEHTALVEGVAALRAQHPGATVILGGDWNTRADDNPEHPQSLTSLARTLDAYVAVRHIDGFLTLGGRPTNVAKLDDKCGSDGHRPVIGKVVPTSA